MQYVNRKHVGGDSVKLIAKLIKSTKCVLEEINLSRNNAIVDTQVLWLFEVIVFDQLMNW